MQINDDNDKKYYSYNSNEVDEGESGEGGEGGQIDKIHFRFRDAASLPPRDDVLPPNEIRRLLIVHKELHKERVNKQKLTRKERAAIKEGKRHLVAGYRQALGMRGGGVSRFKTHPISNRAQFSGIDRQVNTIPNEFSAETNLEMQERLENRFTHRHTPKFNPKPRPRGA